MQICQLSEAHLPQVRSRATSDAKISPPAISLDGVDHRYIASRMTELEPIDAQIGARVTARRKELRMTQTALAKAVGVTFQQVQKYEKGANRIAASDSSISLACWRRAPLLSWVRTVPMQWPERPSWRRSGARLQTLNSARLSRPLSAR